MQEHKPLYLYSREEALRHGERDQWRDSYRENCDCARAIERAIAENYHDNRLEDCAGGILDRYGFTRVNWVLANTMQQKSLAKAEWYTEYALRCGAAPIVPHFYGLYQKKAYTNTCAAAGQSLLWLCDELWIIGDEITEEMRRNIQFCKHLNIHTRKVTEKEIAKLIGGNAK